METHTLSFGVVNILQEDIAEVIINENVEFDIPMVEEYHAFLLSHLTAPFALLINKIYSYTYTGTAQLKIGDLPQIYAMAVVAYTKPTEIATRTLVQMPHDNAWNLKIFSTTTEAIAWLIQEKPHLSQ